MVKLDVDVAREFQRSRWVAIVMLLVTTFGMIAFDSVVAFVILGFNNLVWITRFMLLTSLLAEHRLTQEDP